MFKGNMNAIRYGKIVEAGLVPFVRTIFPDGHRTMTLNIVVTTSRGYSNSMIFTGGKLQQNLLILTPWRTVGVP